MARRRWRERIALFLHRRVFSAFSGMYISDWLRLLQENDFAVDAPNWPRAALITMSALSNSDQANVELKKFRQQIEAVEISPPLFIVGHWRSGTTHLHNLLALDPQFAYPNSYHCAFPHTFLTTERWYSSAIGFFMPERRPQDNVAVSMATPQEDEFGLCTATLCSPYVGWMFPRREEYYDRFLTFREASPAEVARWKAGFLWFVKKLTLKLGKPLLLKSPPHTARIKLLLDLFPGTRFVHIHRDPYTIFQSTRRLHDTVVVANHLQRPVHHDPDEGIIRRCQLMYDAFFEERKLIPAGRFCELSFTDLEKNPVGQVRAIYEKLDLAGFNAIEPELHRYVASVADYRKNEYTPMPERQRRMVAAAWRRNFEEWGYPV